MSRPHFAAVIFDLDGTLIDSESINNAVLAERLVARGLPVTVETVTRDYMGLSLKACYAAIEARYNVILGDDFHQELRLITFDRYATGLRPMPHVPETLARISLPKAVASNSEADKIHLSLSSTNLIRFFEPHLYSYEHVARGKPHPDLYEFAAARLGYPAALTAAVEDSLTGVRAARAAKLTTFAYLPHPTDDGQAMLDLGAIVFDDMRHLPRLLGLAAD